MGLCLGHTDFLPQNDTAQLAAPGNVHRDVMGEDLLKHRPRPGEPVRFGDNENGVNFAAVFQGFAQLWTVSERALRRRAVLFINLDHVQAVGGGMFGDGSALVVQAHPNVGLTFGGHTDIGNGLA